MRWLAYGLGGLVLLVALVVVIGALLPRDHVAAVAARIAAPPDAVWRALTDIAAIPSWRTDVTRVELLPATGASPSWREHGKHGSMTFVVDAAEPPHRLVTRIADEGLPFGGSWEYRIEGDTNGASRVTVIERGSVYNPLFRFVSRFIMGHTATMEQSLRALGRKFGGDATPRVIPIDALEASHGV